MAFEKSYEPLGMTALVVQLVTGSYMASQMLPPSLWNSPGTGVLQQLLMGKMMWLLLTILTALNARFCIIPRLQKGTYTDATLLIMGIHVGIISLLSVAFVIQGQRFFLVKIVQFRRWLKIGSRPSQARQE